MTFENVVNKIAEISTKPLLTLSGTEVTLLSSFIFVLLIVLSIIISLVIQRAFKRAFARKFKRREGTLTALLRLIHYSIILIGSGITLQTIGINISALFAAGAVFAIAIGFAMQNIVQNFVSGVILMVERSIAPGDISEIEGTVVKVIDSFEESDKNTTKFTTNPGSFFDNWDFNFCPGTGSRMRPASSRLISRFWKLVWYYKNNRIKFNVEAYVS